MNHRAWALHETIIKVPAKGSRTLLGLLCLDSRKLLGCICLKMKQAFDKTGLESKVANKVVSAAAN